ncbi:MAG: hypothetical protein GY943_36155, partial [Chloroflexi bacterium]|nr:hypothetical protein [Chloroflexota bacterium]
MAINILLLQARKQDDAARIEERQSFADAAGIPVDQVHTFDLLSSVPTVATVQQFDALMIGGSGDYYVSKQNLPNFDDV